MASLSRSKSRAVLLFTLAVLIVAVAVLEVFPRKAIWLIVLAAMVPVFAALLGGISSKSESS